MKYKLFGIDVFGIYLHTRLNPRIFQCWFLHLKYLRDILETWASSLPDGKEKILLDIGSGENPPYHYFFKNKVAKILTLDSFTKYVDISAPVEKIPLANESVDFILATQVFEHIKNPFKASDEIRRVLKTNGKAFISTHGIWEIHRLPKDYWRFTPDGFCELFHDFKKVEIIPNGGSILCISQLLNISSTPLFISFLKLPIVLVWTSINILALFLDKVLKGTHKLVINYVVILEK